MRPPDGWLRGGAVAEDEGRAGWSVLWLLCAALKDGIEALAGGFATLRGEERRPNCARGHAQGEVAAELPAGFDALAGFGGSRCHALLDLPPSLLRSVDGLRGGTANGLAKGTQLIARLMRKIGKLLLGLPIFRIRRAIN